MDCDNAASLHYRVDDVEERAHNFVGRVRTVVKVKLQVVDPAVDEHLLVVQLVVQPYY